MEPQRQKAPQWVWIALVAAVLVSLGCGLVFGGVGGYLLGKGGRNQERLRIVPTPRVTIVVPRTPRPRTPEATPSVPEVPAFAYGALVLSVVADSPAEEAGLQRGDIITALDGQPLSAERDLTAMIGAHKPGDRVTITLWRGVGRMMGEELEVSATLGEKRTDDGQTVAYLGVTISSAPGMRPRE